MKAALVALALLATPAAADTIIVGYTGTSAGQPFSVIYTYDLDQGVINSFTFQSQQPADNFDTYYISTFTGFGTVSLTIGDATTFISSTNAYHEIGSDRLLFTGLPHSYDLIGGGNISLNSAAHAWVIGPSLETPFDITNDPGAGIFGSTNFSIWPAPIDQILVADRVTMTIGVPEPSTWALLLFGFAFFGIKGIWPRGIA